MKGKGQRSRAEFDFSVITKKNGPYDAGKTFEASQMCKLKLGKIDRRSSWRLKGVERSSNLHSPYLIHSLDSFDSLKA